LFSLLFLSLLTAFFENLLPSIKPRSSALPFYASRYGGTGRTGEKEIERRGGGRVIEVVGRGEGDGKIDEN